MALVKHARSVRVTCEPHAPQELRQIVQQGVDLYNVGRTGVSAYRELTLFLRDGRDEIRGGALGYLWGGWLFVDTLWIDETLRGRGHGRALMRAAESFAREHGAHGIHLSTHSFQAPGFYQRLGFSVCGELEDRPPGHTLYYLRKRLDAAPRTARRRSAARTEKPAGRRGRTPLRKA